MAIDPGFKAEIDKALDEYLHKLAAVILADAKDRCPKHTGHLAESLKSDVFDQKVSVYSDVDYALDVEMGTRPHIIRAKPGGVLANRETGQVFGPVVHHPGTRAQPFMRPAILQKRGKL